MPRYAPHWNRLLVLNVLLTTKILPIIIVVVLGIAASLHPLPAYNIYTPWTYALNQVPFSSSAKWEKRASA